MKKSPSNRSTLLVNGIGALCFAHRSFEEYYYRPLFLIQREIGSLERLNDSTRAGLNAPMLDEKIACGPRSMKIVLWIY